MSLRQSLPCGFLNLLFVLYIRGMNASLPKSTAVVDGADPRQPIRVVSVPASHPYVQRMSAGNDVTVLPDPIRAGARTGQWWPPLALEAHWIREHADEADLLHIHFGTESFTVDRLRQAFDAARAVGWPVVFSLHDIDHPQLAEQGAYRAQLEFLVRQADAVVTLTPGAAAYASRNWNREAVVIRHPRILADGLRVRQSCQSSIRNVGIHLKDLRPNVDAVASVTTTIDAVRRMNRGGASVRMQVWMHRSVRDPRVAALVRAVVDDADFADLIEHERFTDRELAETLSSVDVCVLPYGHGTHSGWLELCWDLGVSVAAPDVGFYGEQHDDGSVRIFSRGSAESLASTLTLLLDSRNTVTARAGSLDRELLRDSRVALRRLSDAAATRSQTDLYRSLLGRGQ
ncbi:hypothetical protein BH09ACT1_BH09ACT1_21610 [soil metagenome]